MRYTVDINGKSLELVEGDITKQEIDAIANAANSALRGGGGVDGAIHRAGGPGIMEECRKIGGCPPGEAVVTTAGRLNAKKVIHTVGPIWRGGKQGEAEILKNAYLNSLKLAEESSLKSIAFPSISTGVYGYPLKDASTVALGTVIAYLKGNTGIELVRFVLFGVDSYKAYENTLKEMFELS
jgi:O-acetyl-ADP-ribose deacetylase (regulator of RNase III)